MPTTEYAIVLTPALADRIADTGPLLENHARGVVALDCAAYALPAAGWSATEVYPGEAIAFRSPRGRCRLGFDHQGRPRPGGISWPFAVRMLREIEERIADALIAYDADAAHLPA